MVDKQTELSPIDLGQLITRLIYSIKKIIYDCFSFLISKWKIIIPLLIVGVIVGFMLDKKHKYQHEIIVSPNFESNDYLYYNISLIDQKIKEKDNVFFQEMGIDDYTNLLKIEVKPIKNIYRLGSIDNNNLEMIKLMTQDISIKEIIDGDVSERVFAYHQIVMVTKHPIEKKEVVDPILEFVNRSDYYQKLQKEYIEDASYRISESDTVIQHLNKILKNLSSEDKNKELLDSNSMVYLNEDNQLGALLETIDKMSVNRGQLKRYLVYYDKIINDVQVITNKKYDSIFSPKIVIFPLLLIFIYIFLFQFIKGYKSYTNLAK